MNEYEIKIPKIKIENRIEYVWRSSTFCSTVYSSIASTAHSNQTTYSILSLYDCVYSILYLCSISILYPILLFNCILSCTRIIRQSHSTVLIGIFLPLFFFLFSKVRLHFSSQFFSSFLLFFLFSYPYSSSLILTTLSYPLW